MSLYFQQSSFLMEITRDSYEITPLPPGKLGHGLASSVLDPWIKQHGLKPFAKVINVTDTILHSTFYHDRKFAVPRAIVGYLGSFLNTLYVIYRDINNDALQPGLDRDDVTIQSSTPSGRKSYGLTFHDRLFEVANLLPPGIYEDKVNARYPDRVCFRVGMKRLFDSLNAAWTEIDTKVFNKYFWKLRTAALYMGDERNRYLEACYCMADEFEAILELIAHTIEQSGEPFPSYHKSEFKLPYENKIGLNDALAQRLCSPMKRNVLSGEFAAGLYNKEEDFYKVE